MRITERQLRKIIREMNISRLVEEVAEKKGEAPTKEQLEKATKAIEKGAVKAQKSISSSTVLDGMKKLLAKLGFTDPCEYVEKERKKVEAELAGMEKAAASLKGGDDPVKNLEKFNKVVAGMGAGSLVGIFFSGMEYAATMAASTPSLAWNAASQWGWGAVSGAAEFVGASGAASAAAGQGAAAAASSAAISTAAASSSMFLGVSYAAWLSVGQVLAVLAIAIWIYRWMLKSGAACTMKKFIADVAGVVGKGAKWAYANVVKPFAEKIWGWGSDLVDKVKGWLKKESIERRRCISSNSRRLIEARRNRVNASTHAGRQWQSLNEIALKIHLSSRMGCLI